MHDDILKIIEEEFQTAIAVLPSNSEEELKQIESPNEANLEFSNGLSRMSELWPTETDIIEKVKK